MQHHDITSGFQQVTQRSSEQFFLDFLDRADTLAFVKAAQGHMRALLNIQTGQRILDVGCGLGHEAQRIARLVGPGGAVVGVDKSEALVTEAQRRSELLDLPLAFETGDALALDFANDTFDHCRMERVLMFLADASQAIAEMARVVRPGGRIALFEFDLDAFMINGADKWLTRRIVHLFADSMPNGQLGRRLPALLREAGLTEVTSVPLLCEHPFVHFQGVFAGSVSKAVAAGDLTQAEADAWWEDLNNAMTASSFYAAMPGFVVAAKKQSPS
mgnify:CR=1 FL=1